MLAVPTYKFSVATFGNQISSLGLPIYLVPIVPAPNLLVRLLFVPSWKFCGRHAPRRCTARVGRAAAANSFVSLLRVAAVRQSRASRRRCVLPDAQIYTGTSAAQVWNLAVDGPRHRWDHNRLGHSRRWDHNAHQRLDMYMMYKSIFFSKWCTNYWIHPSEMHTQMEVNTSPAHTKQNVMAQ